LLSNQDSGCTKLLGFIKDGHIINMYNDIQSKNIGPGTRIWQYSVVLPGAKIGCDCNINAHCFIENDVKVGNRVTVKCGVYLWDGIVVGDDVFIGPNTTFVNDQYPRSKLHGKVIPKTLLGKGCSIGANSTILAGINIGRYAMIGANTLISKNIPPYALVYGHPATIKGYICKCSTKLPGDLVCSACGRSYFISSSGFLQDRVDMQCIRGKHVTLQLVELEDASFIVTLRNYAKSQKFLSATSTNIEMQVQWMRDYKCREREGTEFYYKLQLNDGAFVGLIRIYDLKADIFSGGSWVIAPGHSHNIAVETVILIYDLCFDQLGYKNISLQVVKENQSVIRFHKRFGAFVDREDDKYVYLINTYSTMLEPRENFRRLLGTGAGLSLSSFGQSSRV